MASGPWLQYHLYHHPQENKNKNNNPAPFSGCHHPNAGFSYYIALNAYAPVWYVLDPAEDTRGL